MSRFDIQLKKILANNGKGIVLEIQTELKQQGHYNTGRLFKSAKAEVIQNSEGANLDITMNDYHVFVEQGVKASRIPFAGRSGKNKTSKYIQGLVSFFTSKGLSRKEALSAAFATAYTHKSEGMPTKASSRFSESGRRLRFISEATKASNQINKTESDILNLMESEGLIILNDFEKAIK